MRAERIEPPWKHLDPGIRAAVRVLWDAGFATTDSGDGVSKPADGRVFDFPHVAIMLERDADLRAECYRALELDYSGCGLEPPTPTVCEVSFSALDGKAVLFVGWPGEEG